MATWFLAGHKCDRCGIEEVASHTATLKEGDPDLLVRGVRNLCSVCKDRKDDPDPPPNVGFV